MPSCFHGMAGFYMTIPSNLKDIQTDLKSGLLTCSALVDHYLARIGEQKDLNVFITVFVRHISNIHCQMLLCCLKAILPGGGKDIAIPGLV